MPVFTSSIEVTPDYPTIKPSLNLNFARSRALDPRITFTRASVGTYVGSDGLIKTASNNEPRFDHDPDTLESLGLLIENIRTNYVNHYLVNSGNGWATSQEIIFSSTTEPAPDGSSNNQKMAATTTAGVSHSTYKQVTGTTAGTVHTFSVYMKSAGSDYGYIYVDTAGGRYGGVAVQFSTGNTAVMTANGIGTQTDTSVTAVGNGWYRLSVSGSFSSTTQHYCHIDVGNDLSFSTFAGNGTDGIYVWGAQLENGSFPTSIIPTSGSLATRERDDATIVGESFNSFYNQNEGSLFVESTPRYLASGINHRVCVISGDSDFTISSAPGGINVDYAGTTLRTELFSGSPNSAQAGTGLTVSAGNKNKLAYGLETNNVSVIVNGTQVGTTDTSASMPDPMTKMGIGRRPDTSSTYADGIHVSSIQYYTKRFTNAQLQLLTS